MLAFAFSTSDKLAKKARNDTCDPVRHQPADRLRMRMKKPTPLTDFAACFEAIVGSAIEIAPRSNRTVGPITKRLWIA